MYYGMVVSEIQFSHSLVPRLSPPSRGESLGMRQPGTRLVQSQEPQLAYILVLVFLNTKWKNEHLAMSIFNELYCN